MAAARPAKSGTSRFPWRVAAACLLIGLALSIVSVPVAAIIAQFGPAFGARSKMTMRYYFAPDGTVYDVQERYWSDQGNQLHRSALMHQMSSEAMPQPPVVSSALPPANGPIPEWMREDPRPAFLCQPPAPGFAAVEAYSAGWPMHAAHSMAHIEAHPGTARREHGLLRFAVLGKDFVIPVLPIWTGLLGNTLLYGGTLLLAWWIFRGRRRARRRARGECLACGYTLDGDMERCPECGTPNEHRLQTPTLARRPPPPPPAFMPGG